MTQITHTRSHGGPVRFSDPEIRFPRRYKLPLSVPHKAAQELVDSHSEIEYARPEVPSDYADLQAVAADLPTDVVKGNDTADEIVAFLERFDPGEVETLLSDPSALVESSDRGRTPRFAVAADTGGDK